MAVLKFKNPETNQWEEIVGGGGGGDIPITSDPSPSTNVWIDPTEDLEQDKEDKEEVVSPSDIGVTVAPMYSYGTEDLQAGVSSLDRGKLYFMYE